ncbi:MAG TPA: CopD family protein, partial [Chloroflexota bacterium]|nr:CopD family protein [Chloroflexota bacterium]
LTLGLLLSDSRDNLYALRVATARRLRIWVIASLLVLFVGSILAQLLQAAAASERSLADVLAQSIWLQTLTTTRFGQAALARIVLVDGLLILFVATHARAGWRTQALYTTLSALILLTFSLASHAAASTDPLHVAMIADWLHLVAVGAWTGGLFALAIVGTAGARLAPTDVWFILLRRFARLAVGAIVLLALTGLYSFWRQVGSPGALATPYGETLIVKLALLVPLLLLAGINALFVGVGRWRWDISHRHPPISIFRTLRLEAALGALVVLAAATMTALPPARSVAPPALPPYELTRHAGAVNVSLKVDPYAVGSNNFDVRVTDALGAPLATVSRVTLRFTFLGANLGASSQAMERSAAGAYRLQGSFLSVVGAWMVEAIVQRSDIADDLRVSYRLNVVDPASSRAGDLPDLNSSLVFALLDLMAGAALLVYSQRNHFVEGKFIGAGALALGVALFAMGTIFAPTSAAGVLVNPIPPDAVSLADGKRVYEDSCAVCHGAAGRGNGPLAASLNPRPADFVQHVNLHPDDVLYNWIGEGIPGTAMPPFKDRLSETDRWNVLNYIQATFGVAGTPAP